MHNNSNIPLIKIVRGAPGVGKTTVSQKAVALMHTKKLASISVDTIQHFDCRVTASKDKLKLGVFHAALLACSFISEGFSVIVDYIFDENLDFFIEKLFTSHSHELAPCCVQVFFLNAPFAAIKARNEGRPDPMPEDILLKLYDRTDKTRGLLGCELVLEAGEKSITPAKLAKQIVACNQGGWTAWNLGEQPFPS